MNKYFLKASVLAVATVAGFIVFSEPIFASYSDSSYRASGYRDDGQAFNSNSSLRVVLTANPKTGCGPMSGVDLTATVLNYGNDRRDFTYYFDCENDGVWDKTVTSRETTYNASNLCSYANRGTFTARVRVEIRGQSLADTDIIKANDCGDNNYSYYQSQPYYQTPGYYSGQNGYYPNQAGYQNQYYNPDYPAAVVPVASAPVYVNRGGMKGATSVSTGFAAGSFAGIGISLAGVAIALFFLLKQAMAKRRLVLKAELEQKTSAAKNRASI